MIRRYVILDRGIRHDRTSRGTLGAADHIDRKIILVQVPDQLHHRDIKAIDIPHVVEALGHPLAKLDRILIKLLHRHPGVSLGEIPGKVLIGNIPRLDGRRDLLQFIRHSLRMIDQTVLDEHHRIVVGIVRLAGKRSIHVKHRNTVFHRNKVLTALLRNGFDIGNQRLFSRGIRRPGSQRLLTAYRLLYLTLVFRVQSNTPGNHHQAKKYRRYRSHTPGITLFLFHSNVSPSFIIVLTLMPSGKRIRQPS